MLQYDSSVNSTDVFNISAYTVNRNGSLTDPNQPNIYYQAMHYDTVRSLHVLFNSTLWMKPDANITQVMRSLVNPLSYLQPNESFYVSFNISSDMRNYEFLRWVTNDTIEARA